MKDCVVNNSFNASQGIKNYIPILRRYLDTGPSLRVASNISDCSPQSSLFEESDLGFLSWKFKILSSYIIYARLPKQSKKIALQGAMLGILEKKLFTV